MPCNFGTCRRTILEWLMTRSTLEKILLGAVTLIVAINIILLSTKTYYSPEPPRPVCTTPACLKESANFLKLVNANKNLCEDFYEFTCHKFMETVEDDEKISLKSLQKQQLIEIYEEEITPDDHQIVKTAKTVFQACLDEVQIEWDELKTIKKALNAAGGWPVIEGPDWNETDFDWVQSTYKLRELGYPFSTFFKLSVAVDPENEDKFIFQVSSIAYDYNYGFYQSNELNEMVDVVENFGGNNRNEILAEMEQSYTFWKTLKENEHPRHTGRSFSKFTIKEYQNFFKSFNWLEYINKIAGPAAAISNTDHVLFPSPQNMTKWLNIISKTSKRVQANYIMWQVVEGITHLLHRDLRNYSEVGTIEPTRKDFCFSQTEHRFDPSPIRLMADRRYVSAEKKEQIEELILNMKLAFVKMLKKFDWMEEEDKEKTTKKVNNMAVVIARLENYYDDKIFDELHVDVVETKNTTFLSRVSQASRNYASSKYKQIKLPRSQSFLGKGYLNNHDIEYVIKENVLFVPSVVIQRFFHEDKPRYLNYGTLGTLVGNSFAVMLDEPANEGWSNKTKEGFNKSIRCLKQQIYSYTRQSKKKFLPVYTLTDTPIMLMTVIYAKQLVAERLSHAAYHEWQKKNGEELALAAVRYNPDQLFWISAITTLCPRGVVAELDYNSTADKVFFCITNDINFSKDFSCPLESRMNPSNKCQVL